MHSKSAALVIIVPILRVMVMQSYNSGWSIKTSLKCKLHVPISDIYCICILVSHDLLVLSKHAKHGHSSSPLSCFLFLIYLYFFFVFVSSLLLLFFFLRLLWVFFPFPLLLFFQHVFEWRWYQMRCPICLLLPLTGVIRFALGSLLTASSGCIFGDRDPPTLIPVVKLLSVFVATLTAGTFEVGLAMVVEVVVWPTLTLWLYQRSLLW